MKCDKHRSHSLTFTGPLNSRVIEIQTRQQLKNNYLNIIISMKHSEFLWTSFAFGHLAANVRVRCSEFSKLRVYAVYSNRRPSSLFGEHCEIMRWQTLRKMLEMVGTTSEAAVVATESGGDETATRPRTRPRVPGMRPPTRRRRRLVTRRRRPAG